MCCVWEILYVVPTCEQTEVCLVHFLPDQHLNSRLKWRQQALFFYRYSEVYPAVIFAWVLCVFPYTVCERCVTVCETKSCMYCFLFFFKDGMMSVVSNTSPLQGLVLMTSKRPTTRSLNPAVTPPDQDTTVVTRVWAAPETFWAGKS